mmetsp:Transcript_26509/g.39268  ORF Transcript_26509/g.39268 Transcript_26509/m.39268 type:complete len:200 (-) Transcript_26509:2494-3093(-)
MESETTLVFPGLNPLNLINLHPRNPAIANPRMPMQTSINHLRRKRCRKISRESHRLVIIPGNMTVIAITLQNRMMMMILILIQKVMRMIRQLEVQPLEVRERGRMMIRIRGMKVPRIIRMMKMKVKTVTRLEDTIVSKLGKSTIKDMLSSRSLDGVTSLQYGWSETNSLRKLLHKGNSSFAPSKCRNQQSTTLRRPWTK